MKKIPLRTCIVTREKAPKSSLIRLVKVDDKVIVDLTGKLNGHGAYIAKSPEALEKLKKNKKILIKEFGDLDYSDLYQQLEEIISG